MALLHHRFVFRDKPDFQTGVCFHSGLHSLNQRMSVRIAKPVDSRNVILGRIPVYLPFDVQAPLVLAQRIPFALFKSAQRHVLRMIGFIDQGRDAAYRWRLHDVRHPDPGVMPALQSRGKAHGQK